MQQSPCLQPGINFIHRLPESDRRLVGLYSSGDIRASFACAPEPPGWSENGKSSVLRGLTGSRELMRGEVIS